jgi:hypothetical protein
MLKVWEAGMSERSFPDTTVSDTTLSVQTFLDALHQPMVVIDQGATIIQGKPRLENALLRHNRLFKQELF